MAMARYGDRITVNGSAEFKESIAHAAATANLPSPLTTLPWSNAARPS
jgi:hypothetical protein